MERTYNGLAAWAMAGLWGLVAGGALVIGAAVGTWARVPPRVVDGVMASGSGAS